MLNKDKVALTPPMGWNSWDCYGAAVNEEQLLGNAEYMRDNLKQYGWQYVVCDIQWYEPKAKNNDYNNPSIRTDYGKNRCTKKNRINRIKSPEIEKRNNYYNNKISHVKDSWSNLISKTSKEGQNKVSRNLENNNNIFNSYPYYNTEKNHFKKSNNYEMGTTTQITTLPGCVKRGKFDIKDDKYFLNKNNASYLYKVEHDFNSNVHFGPLTKKEEKVAMFFPVKQRYQGSYQRGVKDNDIFNLNNEEEKQNSYVPGKKLFKNNNSFKSQIIFA